MLAEDKMKLDYVLALKPEDFLERRLQTQVSRYLDLDIYRSINNVSASASAMYLFSQVFKLGLAKSIHHARVLIKQRHIRVRKQV